MLGAGSFEPILARRTVLWRCESDCLLDIWAEIPFTVTIPAVRRVADRMGTISAVAVNFSDLACHLVVPAAILGAFGFEITHIAGDEKEKTRTKLPIPDRRRLVARLSQHVG